MGHLDDKLCLESAYMKIYEKFDDLVVLGGSEGVTLQGRFNEGRGDYAVDMTGDVYDVGDDESMGHIRSFFIEVQDGYNQYIGEVLEDGGTKYIEGRERIEELENGEAYKRALEVYFKQIDFSGDYADNEIYES